MNKQIIIRYEKCLKYTRKMNENTVVNYIYDLKAFSSFINKNLLEITEEDIQEYLSDKKKRGNGANRINFSISALTSFYKYAKKNGYMKYDPTKNIKRETVRKTEENIYLSTYQIYEARRKLEECDDIQLMVYFGLIVCSSPMKQVIGNLKWRDINWKKGYILTKIDEERSSILYLDNYTMEKLQLLKKMRKKEGLKRGQIFMTRYNGLNELSDETQSYWLKKIKKIIGIEKLTFSVIKKTNQHYMEKGRQLSEEKIELINSHKVFPTELKEEILEEVERALNMR